MCLNVVKLAYIRATALDFGKEVRTPVFFSMRRQASLMLARSLLRLLCWALSGGRSPACKGTTFGISRYVAGIATLVLKQQEKKSGIRPGLFGNV
jgi:hypothetical protein